MKKPANSISSASRCSVRVPAAAVTGWAGRQMPGAAPAREAQSVRAAANMVGRAIDGPTPEREAHGRYVPVPMCASGDHRNEIGLAIRNREATALQVLEGRGVITRDQAGAGARLYADWYCAGRSPRVCADWSAQVAGQRGPANPTARLEAEERFEAARAAVLALGESAWQAVEAVCIQGETISGHALSLSPSGRASKLAEGCVRGTLECALNALAKFYA